MFLGETKLNKRHNDQLIRILERYRTNYSDRTALKVIKKVFKHKTVKWKRIVMVSAELHCNISYIMVYCIIIG